MNTVAPIAGLMSMLCAALFMAVRSVSLRRKVQDRLNAEEIIAEEADLLSQAASEVRIPSVLRRWRWIPCIIGVIVTAALYLFTGLPLPFPAALGLIVTLLGLLMESWLVSRKVLLLETQLADGIDLVVGALGAGAGATAGLDAAARESKPPLRPILSDLLARIQLGDDPQVVLAHLTRQVPLETYLLFATSLAVHWDVGGSLASTVAMVGRTIRDRIEIRRKIRSNSIQAQFSIVGVMLVTYFIAAIMWRTNPPQIYEFLESETAAWIVAGSMLLQAVGIVWIAGMSRMRF